MQGRPLVESLPRLPHQVLGQLGGVQELTDELATPQDVPHFHFQLLQIVPKHLVKSRSIHKQDASGLIKRRPQVIKPIGVSLNAYS